MASSRLLLALLASLSALSSATPTSLPFPPPQKPVQTNKTCTVTPLGAGLDDAPQIERAFTACSGGGTVVFPAGATFRIATRLHATARDVAVEWHGTWLFSDDLAYWRANAFPVAFQNHRAGFVLSGERIHVDGHGTGGIDGAGDAWYAAERGETLPGRPMPFVVWNASDVTVERCTFSRVGTRVRQTKEG